VLFPNSEDITVIVGGDSSALLPALTHDMPWQERPASQQPATVYLEGLGQGSKRTMREALFTLVQLLVPETVFADPALAIATFPWEALRFEHTTVLRARLAERYKHSTANKHLSALKGVLKAAWQLGFVPVEDYHRAIDVKRIRGTALPAGRSLKEGELRALLLACQADHTIKGCRDLALIALLFATGLRRQEITLLDVSDYDRDTHALRVRGKGQKERVVYVEAPGAYEALDRWLQVRAEVPGPLFPRIRRGGHLVHTFPTETTSLYKEGEVQTDPPSKQGESTFLLQRLTAQGVYAVVLERVEEAALLKLTTHDFRRNFVGDLLDHGVDLSTTQKLAGHASPATTARYDRRPEATKKKAAGTLHVPLIRWQPANEPRGDER
jgi:site-specific recombinase XerD